MVLLQLFDSLILQGIESPQVSGQHLAVQTLITDRKILRTAWFCLPRIYIYLMAIYLLASKHLFC